MQNSSAAGQKPLTISHKKPRAPKMTLEFWARHKLTGWLSNFKTSFTSSQQITPPPTEDRMIFPWDPKLKNYDTSILRSEFWVQSEFWSPHTAKIQSLFDQIALVPNLDPMDIKTYTISSIIYTWMICTTIYI